MSSRKGLCSLIQLGALLFFNDIGETQHLMEKQARSVDVRRRRNPDGRGRGTACRLTDDQRKTRSEGAAVFPDLQKSKRPMTRDRCER